MNYENLPSKPPAWTTKRFVVLDSSGRWAESIHRQLLDVWPNSTPLRHIQFESCSTIRDAQMLSELKNTVGVIMFLDGRETECLNLVARLSFDGPQVLGVGTRNHQALLPVLLESGFSNILIDITNDIPIASWCVRVLH